MTYRHGLLIGKFYPPHRGHHAAIRAGAAQCERFTVVVGASFAESISLEDRVAWLRAEHADDPRVAITGVRCDAPVDVNDPRVWDAQVASIRFGVEVARPDAPPVDLVVSNDAYGEELARRFDATWLRVERPDGEPSGTAVRRDLAGCWDDLAPATRAGLATRVVVLGAESTGTTTVAQQLAAHHRQRGGVWERTGCVDEFGREYTDIKWEAAKASAAAARTAPPAIDEIVWDQHDFDVVAAEQIARENAAATAGSPLLVCDTDSFATSVWERRYLGSSARPLQEWARAPWLPRHDIYLLTDHVGVPWFDDGMREGDLEIRAAMTAWFARELTAAGHSWVWLTGTLEERVSLAVRTVDSVLAYRTHFGEPLRGPGFGQPA